MPVEVQAQQVAVNSKATFEFDDAVAMYAAGINSFQLFYPDNNDHTVQQLGLTLQAQSSDNIVTVQNTAVLQNASGAQLDPSCSIWIGVVAWVGAVPGTLTLFGPSEQINSGQQSSPINLASTSLAGAGGLAGFNLQYSDDSYDVRGINASVGAQINGNQGYISVSGNMYDGNGNIAYNPTASGLLIAAPVPGAASNPGIIIKTATAQNETESLTVDMGQEVSDALCLITDFNVVYPNTDHYVLGVEAGPWVGQAHGNQVYVNPNDKSQVVITGLRASMWSDDGDCQDDNQSYCSVLVIGIPSS